MEMFRRKYSKLHRMTTSLGVAKLKTGEERVFLLCCQKNEY